jgi:anti-sigma regulatory factor (Ser/Thr protein kinase)
MAPVVQIALRGGYRLDQLDRLARETTVLGSLITRTSVVLDLSGLAFIGPASLATLITTVMDATERDLIETGSRYRPPKNQLVARYLDRMGFNRLLTGADVGGFQHHAPDGFRPVQGFRDQDSMEEVVESLTKAMTEAASIDDRARTVVFCAIREIAQNVLDHAESPFGAVAVAQRARRRNEFEVAVADAGIGILASLTRNARYTDVTSEADAITLALGKGVTSNPGTDNSGLGLARVRHFLRENEGTLLIRSGCGAVEDGHRRLAQDDRPRLCGTVVAIRVKIDRPFDLDLPDWSEVPSAVV